MDFWRLYRLVIARRWLVLGLMAVALASVLVAKKIADSQIQYVASATVLPSPRAMNPGDMAKASTSDSPTSPSDRLARISLFRTSLQNEQDEALKIATQSPLQQKKAVLRALSNRIQGTARRLWAKKGVTEAQIDPYLAAYQVPTDPLIWSPRIVTPSLAADIRNGIDVAPVYDEKVVQGNGSSNSAATMTDYLEVKVHAPTPQIAQQIATLTAAAFVNGYQDSGMQENRSALSQYADNQRQAQQDVLRTQTALYSFKERTGIVDLDVQQRAAVTNLENLKQQRQQAQGLQDSAEAAVAAYAGQLRQASPQTVTNLDPQSRPEVQALSTKIEQDAANLEDLGARLTPQNPQYVRAAAALASERRQLQRLAAQPYVTAVPNPQFQSLRVQLNNAQAEAARTRAAVARYSEQINTLEQSNSRTLPEAQKSLAALQTAYEQAVGNKKAADLAYHNLQTSNKLFNNGLITLTGAASYALPDKSGPGLGTLLVYTAILSLFIGIGAAVGLDSLDNRIQTVGDAEKLLGMRVSAVIPEMDEGDPRIRTRMVAAEPLSPVAECYRLLRTDLLFSADDKPFKSIMGATSKPGQGATTTICNLAVALAQVGKRVILIDADLRRPKLHDFFGTTNETGLTSLLRDECTLEEALKITDIDNLLLLPSGPLPLNPSELLASQRMRTLHERLKPHTDFILVDTPSAIAFSDSAILASFMDAVLLVMRAQEAPRGSEKQVREMLTKARANVVGVVLNGVKPQLVDSYHYHAAYYPQVPKEIAALPAPAVTPFEPDMPAPPQLKSGYEQTLMGVTLDHSRLSEDKPADTEPPAASADDTTVAERSPEVLPLKPGFSLRSLFGTDQTQ